MNNQECEVRPEIVNVNWQVFDEKEWNNSKNMCLKDTIHFGMYENV